MSAATLVDEVQAAGIRLSHDGDALAADVLPGVDLDPYRHRIAEFRPALLAELDLRARIVAAASAAQASFDRAAYDELWRRRHALAAQEMTP